MQCRLTERLLELVFGTERWGGYRLSKPRSATTSFGFTATSIMWMRKRAMNSRQRATGSFETPAVLRSSSRPTHRLCEYVPLVFQLPPNTPAAAEVGLPGGVALTDSTSISTDPLGGGLGTLLPISATRAYR